jgi:endoglucanase
VTPNGLAGREQNNVRSALMGAADRFLADTPRTGYAIPYAPERWPWGSTSSVLNRAMILGLAADYTKDPAARARYRQGVTDAMDFILGRNPLDTSFVSGFGTRSLRNPHHRFWANMLDPKLPPAPPGALSGGPNNSAMSDPVAAGLRGKCAPMKCWADDTRAYALNEVAVNWNAPLVWVSAWLAERN